MKCHNFFYIHNEYLRKPNNKYTDLSHDTIIDILDGKSNLLNRGLEQSLNSKSEENFHFEQI